VPALELTNVYRMMQQQARAWRHLGADTVEGDPDPHMAAISQGIGTIAWT